MKERLTFRPDGSSDTQWREERSPRAGRQERESIKRGERPFWRGNQGAPAPTDPPAHNNFPPARRAFSERPPERTFRPRPADDYAPPFAASAPDRPKPKPEPRPFYDRFTQRRPAAPKPVKAKAAPVDQGDEPDDDETQEAEAAEPVGPVRPKAAAAPAPKRAPRAPRPNLIPRKAKSTYAGPAPTETQKSIPELIARIIEKTGREVAADLALRQELKRRRSLTPEAAAQVARAVFRHFRWLGWLKAETASEVKIAQANGLAEQFRTRPQEISEADLRAQAVPPWTWDALAADAAWLRSLQTEPQLWLRTRPGRRHEVADHLGSTRPGPLPDSLAYDGTEDLFKRRSFQAGDFEIQDLASQAVSHLCAPVPGEFWWDACAGEGGKTLHLADLMQGKGLIYASDRAEWRLERLRFRASRAQCFNFRAVPWNGGTKPPTKTQFDGVLLDAPCSGLGTWGRNPHARWTARPEDIRELAVIQHNLLENVAPSVKPGGRLIYAVCTLSRAETTEIADAFTAQHAEFEPLPLVNPFATGTPPNPQQMLWPQQTGGNGMFIAAWRRKAAELTAPPA